MPSGGSNRRPLPGQSVRPVGDPRWTRLGQALRGGPAATLSAPVVITVGVNATSTTTANLIGSINPNTSVLTPYGPQNVVANPSFEYDTVGLAPAMWEGSTNLATGLVSNTWANIGTKSLHVVTNALAAAQQATFAFTGPDAGPSASHGYNAIRAQPGLQVGGSFVTKVNSMSGTFTSALVFSCYTAGGFLIGTPTTTPTTLSAVGGTFTHSGTTTLPSNTAWFQAAPAWTCTANGTLDANVDAFQLFLTGAAVPSYSDGDQVGHTWLGLPGKSASQQTGTWWWFTYGTSLPLPSATTPATYISPGTAPTTITYPLLGLTPGQTYYVAMVGQNAGGTIYGQTLSFIAQTAIPPVTSPTVPFGQSAVAIPHFNVPFTLDTSGAVQGVGVVEQDTAEEVLACVNTVVACPLGACPQLPTFGIPMPTFAQEPVDTSEIVDAIQEQEPRAIIDAQSQLQNDGVNWGITLETSTAAGTFS